MSKDKKLHSSITSKEKVTATSNPTLSKPPSSRTKANNADKSKTLVDNLARLFQVTSQGCTAVCFVNNKIFISDNDINISTGEDTKKMSLTTEIMQYFSNLADNKSTDDQQKEIFTNICKARIRGEESGYIKLDDEEIEKIALDVLEDSEDWPEKKDEKLPQVAAAYAVAKLMRHDFLKIEKFLKENEKHPLTEAFKGEKKGRVSIEYEKGKKTLHTISYESYDLAYNNEPGYVIISLDTKWESGQMGLLKVHAEMQMLDYFFFTRIIQNSKEPIYVGISKLCCLDCANRIKACNEYYADKQQEKIKTINEETQVEDQEYIKKVLENRGKHELSFDSAEPFFLYSADKLIRNKQVQKFLTKGNLGYLGTNPTANPPRYEATEIKTEKDLQNILAKSEDDRKSIHIYMDYKTIKGIQQKYNIIEQQSQESKKEQTDAKAQPKRQQQNYSSSSEVEQVFGGENALKKATDDKLIKTLIDRYRKHDSILTILQNLKNGIEDIKNADRGKDNTSRKQNKEEVLTSLKAENKMIDSFGEAIEEKKNAYNQRFNAEYLYQNSDIKGIGEQLIDQTKINFGVFIESQNIAYNEEHGGNIRNIRNTFPELNKPIVGIYNIPAKSEEEVGHWTNFAILNHKDKIVVLYKDSIGDRCPNDIIEAAKQYSKNGRVEIIDNRQKEQILGRDCGIYCLKNAQIISENITDDNFIMGFKNKTLCPDKEAKKARREEFPELYVKWIYEDVKNAKVTGKLKQEIINHHSQELKSLVAILGQDNCIILASGSSFDAFKDKENKLYIEIANTVINEDGTYDYTYHISTPLTNELYSNMLDPIKGQLTLDTEKGKRRFKATPREKEKQDFSISPNEIIEKKNKLEKEYNLSTVELLENLHVLDSPQERGRVESILNKYKQKLNFPEHRDEITTSSSKKVNPKKLSDIKTFTHSKVQLNKDYWQKMVSKKDERKSLSHSEKRKREHEEDSSHTETKRNRKGGYGLSK